MCKSPLLPGRATNKTCNYPGLPSKNRPGVDTLFTVTGMGEAVLGVPCVALGTRFALLYNGCFTAPSIANIELHPVVERQPGQVAMQVFSEQISGALIIMNRKASNVRGDDHVRQFP